MAEIVDFPVIIFWQHEGRLKTEVIRKASAPTLGQTLGVLPFTLSEFGLKIDSAAHFDAFWLDSDSWIVDTSKSVDPKYRGRPLVAVDSRLKDQGISHFKALVGATQQYEEFVVASKERAARSTSIVSTREPRVFISHGHAPDWREVQAFIEKTHGIPTLELAQEPNKGRSVLQKLSEESDRCSFAVVVVSGDDRIADGQARARENVMHEIGYFQGKYGIDRVCLLYESGISIPSNVGGLLCIQYSKGGIKVAFGELTAELRAALGTTS